MDEDEKKKKKRAERVPKPTTLEEQLEKLATRKWEGEEAVFEVVAQAYRCGELKFPNRKMVKDDIYAGYTELKRREREALKQKVRESKPDNYIIVQDLRTWVNIQRLLFQEDTAAWDTETTGLNFFTDQIVGISAYLPKADTAFYVPFGHTTREKQLAEDQVVPIVKEWLEDPDNRSIWHNYKYDAHILACHGVWVANPYWDTQVVAKLLNEHESHKLKILYEKYISKSGEVVLFDDIIDESNIAGTDVLLAGVYACGDPHKTYKLFEFQKPFIDRVGNLKNIWYNIERKLLPIDVRIERTGLRVNVPRLIEIEQENLPKIAQAEKELLAAFNIDAEFLAKMSEKVGKEIAEFNFSSNDHLGYLIYDVLGVGEDVPQRLGKKPGSTAGEVIDAIVEDVPELKPLQDYRELTKIVSTYAHKIPMALEVDGRLHSQFDSSKTATGRYASYS